jgi:hypothetical protein
MFTTQGHGWEITAGPAQCTFMHPVWLLLEARQTLPQIQPVVRSSINTRNKKAWAEGRIMRVWTDQK